MATKRETDSRKESSVKTSEDSRAYLRITPTDTALDARSIRTQFTRLSEFAWHTPPEPERAGGRLVRRLFGSSRTPRTIEWLVVTDGDPSHPLQYYVGIEEDPAQGDESADVAAFQRLIEALLPNDYGVERIRWHPDDVLTAANTEEDRRSTDDEDAAVAVEGDTPVEEDTDTDTDTNSVGDTDIPTPQPTYSAIEYLGEATRRTDWQTRLTPVETWLGDDVDARPPLTELVAALTESEVPMVYQALLTPFPSWETQAKDREYDLLEGRDSLAESLFRDLGLGSDSYGEKNREKLRKRRKDGGDDEYLRGANGEKGSPIHRIRATETRDADHSFVVNARVVARTTPHTQTGDTNTVGESLTGVLGGISGPYHGVIGTHSTGRDARAVYDALCDRAVVDPEYERSGTRLPGVANTSRGIVADPREAPGFCLIDGGSLTPKAMEGLAPTPGERARPHGPSPSRDHLSRYRGPGLTLGQFQPGWTTGAGRDGSGYHTGVSEQQVESFLVRLPPALQKLHIAWFGKTGAGKTTGGVIGHLSNHEATDGATLILDQKGDGMAEELSRIQYARTGSLADVIHFDCSQLLPAISFFDIRDQLAAGVARETAIEDVVAHYAEILAQLHNDYYAAGVSVKVIEAVLKALFDPVHGQDAFSHRYFRATLARMSENQSAPAVSDEEVEDVLTEVVTGQTREFKNVMRGVMNRVDEVTLQKQLSTMLNHVHPVSSEVQPTDEHEGASSEEREGVEGERDSSATPSRDEEPTTGEEELSAPAPAFDLLDLLDENVIIVFDMGGLREQAQHAMTLLLLSTLWTALRRRLHHRQQLYGRRQSPAPSGPSAESRNGDESNGSQRNGHDTAGDELPLVNLHVEEASNVAVSGVFSDLLKQARSFGCSVTLSMQYPAQLKHADPEAYDEVLNNVSTIVTGNVSLDRDLAARLATEDMDPQEVANRLRALSRGEWLCALPAGFGEVEPRPFVIESAPLPPGHPDGPHPLSASDELHFEVAQVRSETRTRQQYGLTIERPNTAERTQHSSDTSGSDSGETAEVDAEPDPVRRPRVDSALPYTLRLPKTTTYNEEWHAIDCARCGNHYDPSTDGMQRAMSCCGSPADIKPDNIPITAVNLKLPSSEREKTGLTDTQLMLMQTVHNAQQLRYEPPEYDLLSDSMVRLLEYVGATSEDVQVLIDEGYLTHDADHPHRLYSVTPAGRKVLGESYREGVDFGHGKGDLEETSLHVMMTEVGYRLIVRFFEENPDSPVTTVIKYFDIEHATGETTAGRDEDEPEARRIDVAGLDADGNVVVALEAERVNHDVRRAAPADFDKMAACDPDHAIWICWKQREGHKILRALNDPLEGEPRVEKEYSSTTPPHQYRIDTPGFTAMYNVEYVRDRLDDETFELR